MLHFKLSYLTNQFMMLYFRRDNAIKIIYLNNKCLHVDLTPKYIKITINKSNLSKLFIIECGAWSVVSRHVEEIPDQHEQDNT